MCDIGFYLELQIGFLNNDEFPQIAGSSGLDGSGHSYMVDIPRGQRSQPALNTETVEPLQPCISTGNPYEDVEDLEESKVRTCTFNVQLGENLSKAIIGNVKDGSI